MDQEETASREFSCARHLTNSVGDDTTQLARPPTAPANQTWYNGTPTGFVGSVTDGGAKYINVLLYATKRIALSAPYPNTGAAAPE
jgi:hypothetical protein